MSGRQQSPAETWTADRQESRRGSWPYCRTQQLNLSAGVEWRSAWLGCCPVPIQISWVFSAFNFSLSDPIHWSRPSTHAANWVAAVCDSDAGWEVHISLLHQQRYVSIQCASLRKLLAIPRHRRISWYYWQMSWTSHQDTLHCFGFAIRQNQTAMCRMKTKKHKKVNMK